MKVEPKTTCTETVLNLLGKAPIARRLSAAVRTVPWVSLFFLAAVLSAAGCRSALQEASAEGLASWEKGDFFGAIGEYEKVIALDPRNDAAYVARGTVRVELGDLDGAIADCTRAIELDPTKALAFLIRGNARFYKNDGEGAIADYARAIELDPPQAVGYYNRGLAKAELGDQDGAIADYTRAIELRPRYPEALQNRGRARQSKGDLDLAIADLTRALEINPKDVESYCARGVVKLAKQDLDGAILDFAQALKIDPESVCLHANRGIARLRKEDWDGAIEDFTQVIDHGHRDVDSLAGLAMAFSFKGNLKRAEELLHQALEANAKSGRTDREKILKEALDKLHSVQKEVAARVDGEILTWDSVREGLKGVKPADITPQLLHAKRQELVSGMLIRQFAVRNGLTVFSEDLDDAVLQDSKKYASPEEHRKVIMIQHGSVSQYRESLEWSLLRAKALELAMATQKSDPELKGAAFQPLPVPEETLRQYYDAHRDYFQQIMEQISFLRIGITVERRDAEGQKRAVLESLLRRLEKGAEFTMLAWFYSDVRRAKEFRDRGVTRKDLKGIYAPETIEYLFDGMKEGETSPIVRDGATLNLFRMEQKVKRGPETFEEAKGRIQSMMDSGVRAANVSALVQALRRSAHIEPEDVFQDQEK